MVSRSVSPSTAQARAWAVDRLVGWLMASLVCRSVGGLVGKLIRSVVRSVDVLVLLWWFGRLVISSV